MSIDRFTKSQANKQVMLFIDWLHTIRDQFDRGTVTTLVSSDDEFKVEVRISRHLVQLTGQTDDPQAKTPEDPQRQQPSELKGIYRQLIAKATAAPCQAKVLINRTQYKYNSHSRAAVKQLLVWGYLVRDELTNGVMLPCQAASGDAKARSGT